MNGPRFTRRRRTAAILAGLLLAGVLTTATLILSLRVTLTAPAVPMILRGPDSPTGSTTAIFIFTDSTAGAVFQCSLDGVEYTACTSGQSYGGLSDGRHTFRVTASKGDSPASRPASYGWVVDTRTGEGALGFPGSSNPPPAPQPEGGFPIGGSISGAFAPGVTLPLDLSLTNPFGFDLKVLAVTITVQPGTTRGGRGNPGCDGPTNMVVTRGFGGPVTVPAHATRSLQALGVPQAKWPQVEMLDLSSNQDACKSTTFTFSYTGTATQV